jgi:hypothetical protein
MSRSDVQLLEKARRARTQAGRVREFARRAPPGAAAEQLRLHAAWLTKAAGVIERRVVSSKPHGDVVGLRPKADVG